MNIITVLRKPYIAMILSFLIFFVSCNQYETDYLEKSENIVLNEVILRHLELSNELEGVFKSEKSINLNIFNKSQDFFNSIEEFEKTLIEAEVVNVKKITNLVFRIQKNLNAYIVNSISKNNYNQSQITNIITKEIIKQSKIDDGLSNRDPYMDCVNGFDSASNTCSANYAISLAGIAAAAFFSFGVGTIIGVGVASGIFLNCQINASQSFNACIDAVFNP